MKFSSKGDFRENRFNVVTSLCKVLNECWEKFATSYIFMDQMLFFFTCIFFSIISKKTIHKHTGIYCSLGLD